MAVAPMSRPGRPIDPNASTFVPEGRAAPEKESPAPAGAQAHRASADAWTLDRLGLRVRGASRALGLHLARAVSECARVEVWTIYGYARVDDYVRGEHDRTGRWFQNSVKLGVALERFPSLGAAMAGADGRRVGFTAAAKIAGVATAETIDAWIDRARHVTVRELSEEIAAQRSRGETGPGPAPGEPGEGPASGGACGAPADGDAGPAESAGGEIPWGACATRTTLESEDPDIEPRAQLGFAVPRKVALAFEETLDLHRSVTASEATVQSFVEALAAEGAAGLAPPDCTQERLQAGDRTARVEHAQARIHKRWEQLKAQDDEGARASDRGQAGAAHGATHGATHGAAQGVTHGATHGAAHGTADGATHGATDGTAVPGATGRRVPHARDSASRRRRGFPVWDTGAAVDEIESALMDVEQQAESMLAVLESEALPGDDASRVEQARAVHERLCRLLRIEDEIERCLGRLLYLMSRRGDFATLGFASLCHYGVERLDMPRRTAECRAGILWKLQRLPQICAAYECGTIGLEAAEELYRCIGPHRVPEEVETQWVAHATGLRVKRLREERRRLRRQELATPEGAAVPMPGAPPCHPPPCPRPATDAEWLASLRRAPGDTRARLRALQLPGVDDPNATLSDLRRNDQFLRLRLGADVADVFRGALEAARSQLTKLARTHLETRDGCAQAGGKGGGTRSDHTAGGNGSPESAEARSTRPLPGSLRAAVAFVERERRVPTWVALLALLEDYAETHDDPAGFPVRRRDAVYQFWGYICRVPGCTVRAVEDHHVQYRSRQGSDALHNQIALCPFHHRQGEHGDFLQVWGEAPGGLHWLLGALGVARRYHNERRIDAPEG